MFNNMNRIYISALFCLTYLVDVSIFLTQGLNMENNKSQCIQDQCFLFNPIMEINVVSLIVVHQPLTAVNFICHNCYLVNLVPH